MKISHHRVAAGRVCEKQISRDEVRGMKVLRGNTNYRSAKRAEKRQEWRMGRGEFAY